MLQMKRENRLKGALCVNAAIVVLEGIALVLSVTGQGMESFLFYTQDSNYFAMAVSLLFCVYAKRELRGKGKFPDWIYVMRYAAVCCLMVTFFVVLFVLMPMMEENPLAMLYEGSMLYQHTICPVLAFFSFFVFEKEGRLPGKAVPKALIPTLAYALVMVTLNICRVTEGPYFFLMVYAQPWYMSVLWCFMIGGIAALLAFGVRGLHNLLQREKSSEGML